MASASTTRATLDDLYRIEGKAELINGTVVRLMASGDLPALVAFAIAMSLHAYAMATGRGVAYPDGLGYAIAELPSGRESFAPDASYYVGPRAANRLRFIQGTPALAVEVRSENDYGSQAAMEMAAKRVDYFTAGTQVVWDVDPVAETVAIYRTTAPTTPTIYRRGDLAEAEPAVPGWTMAVNEMFDV
jgi:Uma2 family endonuclease